ncbi:Oidioi.mRNA.OKI2018_I69.chr1.g2512.t1.cds [Oikopleura dioica]|uniref:Oidioi.mRNA.OKI2018_I69.chr1.g2512.t1.cds n=1 Tax=Oikopleura dioica TaxID=34765 RepID=A0ABN7SRB1_OIKDI|nr:Oidioi.mRNA.OKI2018_I69.chr1.g2512.t1.cds [Oikopleura dioica]
MEVDIPTPSNNYTIKKIETEVGTENLTQQRVKFFLKANQREIQIDDLKHIIVEGSVKVSNATSVEINLNRADSRRNVIKIKFREAPIEACVELSVTGFVKQRNTSTGREEVRMESNCDIMKNVKSLFGSIDSTRDSVDFKPKDLFLKRWPTHRKLNDLYMGRKIKSHQVEITMKVMRSISTGQGMRNQEGQNPVVVVADKEYKFSHVLDFIKNKNDGTEKRDKFIWGTPKIRGQTFLTNITVGELVTRTEGLPIVMMPVEQRQQALSPMTGNPTARMEGHSQSSQQQGQHQAPIQQQGQVQQQNQQLPPPQSSVTSTNPVDNLLNPANNLPFNPTGYGLLSDHLIPRQRQETIEYFSNQPLFNPDEAGRQQLSQAGNRLRHIAIFHRNFRAALVQCVNNARPEDRPRYNDPERMTPATPQARDLGHTVRLLADDIRTFGLELIRLGAEFHRDPNFMGDDEGREKFRRLIQNNMDAARYLHPLLTNLTNITIPLPHDPPRYLSVYQPR